jgi:hypothetical protein
VGVNSQARAPHGRERQEAAAYLAELSAQMSALAKQHGMHTIAYLMDMAKLEAENEVNPIVEGPDGLK